MMCYYITLVALNAFYETEIFHLYEICLKGSHTEIETWKCFVALILCTPDVIVASSTLVTDYKCYQFLKNLEKSAKIKRNRDEIALRATTLSFALAVPTTISCPILGVLFYICHDQELKFYITFIICVLVAIFRSPIVAFYTFKTNEKNRKKKKRKKTEDIEMKELKDDCENV